MLLLKDLLNLLLSVDTSAGVVESLRTDEILKTLLLKGVACGHEVGVVDTLDERLDSGTLGDLLVAVLTVDLLGVTLNTNHKGMAVGVSLGALVESFDNDDLFTGLATTGDDGDFIRFQEFRHGSWL